MTIYIMYEFIIGLVCLFGGFGMIYTAIHLDRDKFDCAFMAFVFFVSAVGFIGGSMQRPSPSKRDVLKGDAVYVSDTINNNGEKVIMYDIVWKDMLPDNYLNE